MGRVVVVTFDENEEEKLNELLHFLSAKKYSEMPGKQNRVLDYGALKINAEYRSVESNGELVQLTNYEFEILYLLAKNPGRIFSKEQIYTQVWKEPYYGAEDNVMGIIRRIRKKIEPDSAKPRYILNVWGICTTTNRNGGIFQRSMIKNRIVVIEKSTNKNRTFVLFSCVNLYTFKNLFDIIGTVTRTNSKNMTEPEPGIIRYFRVLFYPQKSVL